MELIIKLSKGKLLNERMRILQNLSLIEKLKEIIKGANIAPCSITEGNLKNEFRWIPLLPLQSLEKLWELQWQKFSSAANKYITGHIFQFYTKTYTKQTRLTHNHLMRVIFDARWLFSLNHLSSYTV